MGVHWRVTLALGWRVGWGGSRELFSFAKCRLFIFRRVRTFRCWVVFINGEERMGRYGCCVFVHVIVVFVFFEFAGERKRSGGKKEGKRVDEVVRWGFEAAELERGEYKVYASVLVCVCVRCGGTTN